MRVWDSQPLLFVHVRKTGGKTVERVLDRNIEDVRRHSSRRHDTLAMILDEEPALFDCWTFGFVRNPWARLVSWWSMIDRAARVADQGVEQEIRKFETYRVWAQVRGWDFETFVLRGLDEVEPLRVPQLKMLTAGDRRADFIGRTKFGYEF